MINCCVEAEWITISGLNLVSLIILGWLSHSGRSAETSQSSQPSRRHFIWFVVLTGLPCHDFAPPSVVNINALVLGRVVSPLAVIIIAASSWRTLLCLHVYRSCERAILQELNTCSAVCLPWHSVLFLSPTVPDLRLRAGDRTLIW